MISTQQAQVTWLWLYYGHFEHCRLTRLRLTVSLLPAADGWKRAKPHAEYSATTCNPLSQACASFLSSDLHKTTAHHLQSTDCPTRSPLGVPKVVPACGLKNLPQPACKLLFRRRRRRRAPGIKVSDGNIVEPVFCMHGTRAVSVAMTNPTKPRWMDVAMSEVPLVTCTELGRKQTTWRGSQREASKATSGIERIGKIKGSATEERLVTALSPRSSNSLWQTPP